MTFASRRDPGSLAVAQRVLAIPNKRFDRPMVGFLADDEIEALLDAPDPATWSGRRDRILFATMYNTGARVSEIVSVRRRDLVVARPASVLLHGKGRKERCVPLWTTTASGLRTWLAELPDAPEQPVFPNRTGGAMSRSGVEARLDLAVGAAARKCPALAGRRISPHTLRHYVPCLTMSGDSGE
jgi:site-specific recombinase XerD